MENKNHKVPVTVFTGFLGAGKTTIILNAVSQLPENYKVVLLKNEFGQAEVDSQIAQNSNIEVKEMVNGCLCCVLVTEMEAAIKEIVSTYNPDHLIIETSGSAYPAPIALELKKLKNIVFLDGIVTVIDALNFTGYKDKSYTAKLQAKYTDLILINKHETISERELDQTLDDVYEINPDTPKIKTSGGNILPDVIFGLHSKFIDEQGDISIDVQSEHHKQEVDLIEFSQKVQVERDRLDTFLASLPKSDFFRIKGVFHMSDGAWILNYVFGKWDWIQLNSPPLFEETRLVFMGQEFEDYHKKIAEFFNLPLEDVSLHQA